MANFNIAQARRFWIQVHEGGTLTSVDVGRMVTALEDLDTAFSNLHREYERRGKELGKSETREAALNDRITVLEEHLCLTQEKLDEADGALNICSASWGECNRILDETKVKLAQQDDDDFYPATAGDDPIWLGGVEYITKSRSDELVKAGSVGMTEEQLGTIVIADSVEHEDGSATYTFDMDEASSKKVTELGLEFILTCAAYGLDIQDALELISTEGKMRELQKLGQEYDNG